MAKEEIIKRLNFLREIDKLKQIKRRVYTSTNRRETDPEHTWHVAMFILVFNELLPAKLDRLKMLEMALIHDLPEIYAGDTFTYSNNKKGQREKEDQAANFIFSKLPTKLKKDLLKLYSEYEQGVSPEAKFVQAFDKLQPILQNILSEGRGWKNNKIKLEKVKQRKNKYMEVDPSIYKAYKLLIQEVKNNKLDYQEKEEEQ